MPRNLVTHIGRRRRLRGVALISFASSIAVVATVAGALPPFLSESAWSQAASESSQTGGAGESDSEASNSEAELAKEVQNPVANLISVPLQNNFDFLTGPNHPLRYTLNFQPVIPVSISEDWSLISRIITPVIYQGARPGGQELFGLGDMTPSLFFSQKQPYNGITWGVGPVFLLPTATEDALGSQKLGLGPSIVALRQESGGPMALS